MKKILFVCIENSCRSQMAEAFAGKIGKNRIEAHSAGSRPSGKVNPMAIKVMRETGLDISGFKSKGFEDLPTKIFDYAVTMGCGDICPFVPAKRHIRWDIEDPSGRDIRTFRKTRDILEEKIRVLINDITEGKI